MYAMFFSVDFLKSHFTGAALQLQWNYEDIIEKADCHNKQIMIQNEVRKSPAKWKYRG